MNLYDRVKKYLEVEPRGRERANRGRAVVNVLLEMYPHLSPFKGELLNFCRDYESASRNWRDILQFHPELRGSDYVDKKVLEQKTLLQLDQDRLDQDRINKNIC